MPALPKQDGEFFYVLQGALKIIYVDDDPILREFATVNLASDQTSVTTAADGAEALTLLEAQRPDIMLLDLEMPRMDGFEVLEAIRASDAWRDLPVIVATGREDVAAIDRAFQAGATDFVVKPMNWRLLSYQIRYVLRSSRAASMAATARPTAEATQIEALARQGARFLALAVRRDPSLRDAAAELARIAEAVLLTAYPQRAA
jgi:DNA-binding response OmpR family regulator